MNHPFDWAIKAPADVGARTFPPIVGGGRGHVLEPYECVQCGRSSAAHFGIHRPLNSGFRTCPGTVVPRSQVGRVRREERRRFIAAATRMARAEGGMVALDRPPATSAQGLWQIMP